MPLCDSLTLSDSRQLKRLEERKAWIGEMARQLGRNRSTICHDLKRNTFEAGYSRKAGGFLSL